MKRLGVGKYFAVSATLLFSANLALGQASFKTPVISAGIMLPDNKTFVVSIATKATLIYFDTVADKETKRVEVEFQPTIMAAQGSKLFVGTKGTATVHVLDAETGKEEKVVKVPGEPLQALGCHPKRGLLYAVNTNNEVFSIDAEKGTATKTKAKGQLLAVDTGEGKYVYTGIQKPIRDQLVIQGRPGQRATVSLARANLRALMLKYEIDGADLKPVAANDNAAINGRAMSVSADGKLVAMAGGGGWRSKTDPKANYAVAVFDTADMETLSGQVETGAYPAGIAFHPVLNLGAAYKDGAEIFLFNAKSFATKEKFKLKGGAATNVLTFGGQGTKVVWAPMPGIGGDGFSTIEFLPIPLTDQDKEALKKVYGK